MNYAQMIADAIRKWFGMTNEQMAYSAYEEKLRYSRGPYHWRNERLKNGR